MAATASQGAARAHPPPSRLGKIVALAAALALTTGVGSAAAAAGQASTARTTGAVSATSTAGTARAAGAASAAAAKPGSLTSAKPNARSVCPPAAKGAFTCFALQRTDIAGATGLAKADATPSGFGPVGPAQRVQPAGRRRRRGDGRHRRRLRRPERRGGPGAVPGAVRAARRAPPPTAASEGRRDRRHQLPDAGRRLVRGDLAGPGHGLRGRARRAHPPGRGRPPPNFTDLGAARRRGGGARRRLRLQLLRLELHLDPGQRRGPVRDSPRWTRTTTTRAWRSSPAPATAPTAWPTRPPRSTSPRSAAPRWSRTPARAAGRSRCGPTPTAARARAARSTSPSRAFQKDTGCAMRAVADVSAVADPATGVSVYDTYQATGWQVYGGTSASSPLHRRASTPTPARRPPGRTRTPTPTPSPPPLNDVTQGSTAPAPRRTCAPPAPATTARPAWARPTA